MKYNLFDSASTRWKALNHDHLVKHLSGPRKVTNHKNWQLCYIAYEEFAYHVICQHRGFVPYSGLHYLAAGQRARDEHWLAKDTACTQTVALVSSNLGREA